MLVINRNGLPIFVRNRTYDQIKQSRMAKLNSFGDKLAQNDNLPLRALAFDINGWVDKDNQNLSIVMTSCLHLDCVPSVISFRWFCLWHELKFNISGNYQWPSLQTWGYLNVLLNCTRLVIEA
ncbi:MAG: hypothetical protein ACTS4W_00455 [Candidatus Hodgkinia cicadicola]